MDETKPLSEVCSVLEVSRRAVQGYENAGLVSATGKNKYGHLLYDEEAQRRIKQIRLLQQLGFRVKEIKDIIDAPAEVAAEAIKRQICKCQLELAQKKEIIRGAEVLIAELSKNNSP